MCTYKTGHGQRQRSFTDKDFTPTQGVILTFTCIGGI